MPSGDLVFDQYRRCVESCTHDLARGVLLAELQGKEDGPYESPFLKTPVGVGPLAYLIRQQQDREAS